jgi:uncharacterized membrane protein
MPFGIGPGEMVIVMVIALLTMAPILVVVALLRRSGNGLGSDPLRLLDERLARGEISREEYLEVRRILGR